MDTDQEPIGRSDLAVMVEMGEEFEPGPRTAEALQQLVGALQEEHGDHEGGDEVSGFQFKTPDVIRSFSFVTAPDQVARYEFFEGWPAKWKGFSLDGKSTDQ